MLFPLHTEMPTPPPFLQRMSYVLSEASVTALRTAHLAASGEGRN